MPKALGEMTGKRGPDEPGAREEVQSGQGMQIGAHNKQVNQFIGTYVETQVIQAPSAPDTGPGAAEYADRQWSRLTGERALKEHWIRGAVGSSGLLGPAGSLPGAARHYRS